MERSKLLIAIARLRAEGKMLAAQMLENLL